MLFCLLIALGNEKLLTVWDSKYIVSKAYGRKLNG